ncbi:HAD family hydrolase [Bacillus salipaludis]|uniref:HAD family hydrolase n=1 Tax=Bacillus salipaludis TaxID=2547811 RepID=UPI002E1A280F|nr:HAD family hydrolase [Bacillus salipaludis]
MRCVSIDLDGTLLNSQQEISKENMLTLIELQEKGYDIILNTGRAYADIIKLKALQNIKAAIFCLNGSVLYSKERELLYETTIPIVAYKEIFSVLKKLGVWVLVYTNYGGLPSTLPPLHNKSNAELNTLFQEYDYDEILMKKNLKIYKLIALVQNEQLEKIETVKKELGTRVDSAMASSFPNNVEITSNEAQKGRALLRYQQIMNLSFDEIFAFGDGGNDLTQFEVATTSIAMGNAPLYIQQKADLVTKTNDEDGFAYAVRHLLQLLKQEARSL